MNPRPRPARVASTPDVQRIGLAIRGPGLDTRIWVSLAYVTAVGVDPDHGVFADVVLVPSQHSDTARVGTSYAGVGVGLMAPLAVGDEVLVAAPSGDPDEGWGVVARLWSASDLQPSGWNNDSWTLLSDKPVQIVGSVVRIGAQPQGTKPGASADYADHAVLGDTYRKNEDAMLSGIDALAQALSTFALACEGSTDPAVISAATALSGALVAAGWNPTGAGDPISVFKLQASKYLSASVQVGK